jgi:hypothetical protein
MSGQSEGESRMGEERDKRERGSLVGKRLNKGGISFRFLPPPFLFNTVKENPFGQKPSCHTTKEYKNYYQLVKSNINICMFMLY